MKVKDVMTTDVRSIHPEASLKDAARLMTELRVSGLPVVVGHVVVGVLSEGDILVKQAGLEAKQGLLDRLFSDSVPEPDARVTARTVGEAMTSPAVKIGPD